MCFIWRFQINYVILHPVVEPRWWNGRHEGLKIPWPEKAVRVRVPLAALGNKEGNRLVALFVLLVLERRSSQELTQE